MITPYLISNVPNVLRRNKKIKIFFILTIIFSLINIPVTGNGFGGTINFIVCFTMAIYLLENPHVAANFSFLYSIYIIGFLWQHMIVIGEDAHALYEENLGLSRNFPGYLLVASTSLWCFTKKETMGWLPLSIPVLAIILTYLINGRSSFAASIMLLLVCLAMRGNSRRTFFLFLGLTVALIIYYYNDIVDLYQLSRLSEEGSDNTARHKIWSAYFNNLDLVSLMFGLDTKMVPVIHSYADNPHNAFLNFHQRMGLFPTAYLLFFICHAIKWFVHNKNIVYAMVLSIYIFRIFFDSCCNSTYDFILYYMIFYPYMKEPGLASGTTPNTLSGKKGLLKRLLFCVKAIA